MAAIKNDKVVVVGGCGHVGLPLSIVLAHHFEVAILDIDQAAIAAVRSGRVPFQEEDAQPELERVLNKTLTVHDDPTVIHDARWIVVVIGTPVDEHLNPNFSAFHRTIASLAEHFRPGQTLVLRSTVFPGTTERVARQLGRAGAAVEVAFCPERVAEGHAIREIRQLPQIVASTTPAGVASARQLFAPVGCELIELSPLEAELAKLFTNVWRYVTFAVANQFYTIASDHGADHQRILGAMRHHYPRTAGLPGPGFAAGPCLFKDTMQLAAFADNQFFLGHAAMLVNEGFPAYLVTRMRREIADLPNKTVGILGMAFKAGSDDPRESLSYKLKRLLRLEAREVLTTDPLVRDSDLLPFEDVVARSDVLVLATPHREYLSADFHGKPVYDPWLILNHREARS